MEAKWTRELFELYALDAKERLVEAPIEDIPRVQGEAKVMKKISQQLNAATALMNQSAQPPQ